MPYLASIGLMPHMSPSRLALRDAVLRNPKGPEPLAPDKGAAAAFALTGCSMNSPEPAAAAGAVVPPVPTGVSVNSPELPTTGVEPGIGASAGGAADWAKAFDAHRAAKALAQKRAERRCLFLKSRSVESNWSLE